MTLEDLALVGNCQSSALADRFGRVVWCCLPRFDSEPVFGRLLDEEGGDFEVAPAEGGAGQQRYLPNTNVVETVFDAPDGRFRVVDFMPRFFQYERVYRPTMLVRIVEPLAGAPRVAVRCDPRLGWSKAKPAVQQGSNHLRYEGFASSLRLTTDVPLSYLGGRAFSLTGRRHLVLTWGTPVEEPLPPLCLRFLDETSRYWQRWVKHCNVPPRYQDEVIRSALALKLHCFEDTGAIIAATTTSIPEAPGSGRTWDYRYCWLRDAYYVLSAFRLLGHFEERERFVQFLLDVAAGAPNLELAPLYRVDGSTDLAESTLESWRGYEGNGPVRVGNGAAIQRQHDVYGEMALALAPVFLDDRFREERTPAAFDLVERLAHKAISVAGTPDAGIWEFRSHTPRAQTFSSLMCWAAADRVARVCDRHAPEKAPFYRAAAERISSLIVTEAWSESAGGFTSEHGGRELDAALLQMAPLHFLPPGDPRLARSVDAIQKDLTREGWLLRYRADALGESAVAFTLCTFWLVEALACLGRHAEARDLMERARLALSPTGLLSEDYDPAHRRMWGNFPQAYSHVGLIHAAFAASPRWRDVL